MSLFTSLETPGPFYLFLILVQNLKLSFLSSKGSSVKNIPCGNISIGLNLGCSRVYLISISSCHARVHIWKKGKKRYRGK